jgi:hypothetical protein
MPPAVNLKHALLRVIYEKIQSFLIIKDDNSSESLLAELTFVTDNVLFFP